MSSNADLRDTDELSRFRQQWKAELQQRRAATDQSSQVLPPITNPQDARDTSLEQLHPAVPVTLGESSTSRQVASPPLKEDLPIITGGDLGKLQDSQLGNEPDNKPSKRLDKALVAYRAAVQAEQRGALDDAVQYYRQAFRLDPFVDKAYIREEQRSTQQIAAISRKDTTVSHQQTIPSGNRGISEPEISVLERGIELLSLQALYSSDTMAAGFLSFDPEDEKKGCFMSLLSDELILMMLRFLDVTSIERFALVDRKARVLTLDHEIWRPLVRSVYFYPQVSSDYSLRDAVRYHQNDYRRLYIEQPRIRLDGVYIAVCHYMRQGLSENVWIQPSHLVTYHRYLRFFPDGRVICLRANEDQNPQVIIPQLRSTPAMNLKDMSIGRWRLDGSTILISDIKYVHEESPRYAFQMCLALKSKPMLGRWNRLDFLSFDSVHPETGETEPLPLKNERSFWFSKVRSFA